MGGGTRLSQALDRDVYQIVRKLLDDETTDSQRISIATVYDAIKRSNSSLKRRPKIQLEDSIERILSAMQDVEDDSDASDDMLPEVAVPIDSNAMNRSIVRSFKAKKPASIPGPEPAEPRPASVPPVKKRFNTSHDGQTERPAKRSKLPDLAPPTHITLADLGGMDAVIKELKETIMLPLKRTQRYIDKGLKIPRGILLHGPPGCGKTALCEATAAEMGVPFLQIAAPSIVSGMSGESEKALRQHFEMAVQMAPCLMFIDEIDAITPKRESAQREMERRIVGQLLTCMDDLALEKTGGRPVIVLAATNRPDSLDPALRRAGRFDTEINIGVPSQEVRQMILQAQTRKTKVKDVDFEKLAKMTPGFVGADLESLVYKAGACSEARYLKVLTDFAQQIDVDMHASEHEHATDPVLSDEVRSFRAIRKMLDEQREPPDEQNDAISMDDFLAALPTVQPSSKREGFATIPDTTWSNVGALKDVREQLHNAIVEPIRKPEKYKRFGISVPAGVLLWGPPGCGKTLLAKAVANESRANFISVKGPELLNKFVGESEAAVRKVFMRARSSVPCVIFFDELDALVPKRDDSLSEASARVVNTLLTELDGISNRTGIYVIAATNRPKMIDPAMLRPGRLGKHLFVGPPEEDERVEIMTTLMSKMPVADASLVEFGRRCDKFSGADLSNLAYEAAQHAIERNADVLELQDLQHALKGVKPSVGDMAEFAWLRKKGLASV